MDFSFGRFPFSYRLSQRLMSLVLVALASLVFGFFAGVPVQIRIWIVCACGLVVLVSFGLTAYVVVRYPYISLVIPTDGDLFSQQQGSSLGRLVRILNSLAILFLIVGPAIVITRGIDTPFEIVFLVYSALMLPLLLFLRFLYSSESHPTLATLIRSTFGIGLALFPIFLPVVAVGSVRCRRLLRSNA